MNICKRIFLDIVIILFIIFGWWYIALALAFVGLFRFPNYFEIIFFGILYDALFRMFELMGYYGYFATIISIVFFTTYQIIKGTIRK